MRWILALLYAAPMLALLWLALLPDKGGLSYLSEFGLLKYVLHSAALAATVGAIALLVGVYTAWLVTRYEFLLRRLLEWALLLPLAVPSYISAMVYGHLLDVAGPVQQHLRDATGMAYGDYWFPEIRSPAGAAIVLALALYPYIYALARIAFAFQCGSLFENARLLGLPERLWLRKVALPVARPALMMGLALVMMEALADFGTVSLYGVPTVTTGIFRLWNGLGDPLAAAKLAALLMLVVLAVVWLERHSRRKLNEQSHSDYRACSWRRNVSPLHATYKIFICSLPVLLGFAIPVMQLLLWSGGDAAGWSDAYHWRALSYSLLIGIAAALLTVLVATCFAYGLRGRSVSRWLIRLAAMGYAIPGSVIAVAIFMPLLLLDRQIADIIEQLSGHRPSLWLTGSIVAMVLACSIRFLAVALSGAESGLRQMSQPMDDAARLLGSGFTHRFRLIHWPCLRASLGVAALMVMTDTIKELPASMLLRPFDVDTLAIRSYELASVSRMQEASVPALLLVALCLCGVAVMAFWQHKQKDAS